ncbi:Uma2 family endonuclease [Sphingomonas bacterium]|uniref:Uma2 family endonuclease n=1 Tax=Sphingomonas bacterium TaxID=1895847 RepID=UPI001575BBF6|nr:Uma2 family endonuclease [Sphingomonas bacterium]
MRADPAYRKITADEFLAMNFGTDKKFELEDGVIVMMTGGTEPHAWVQGNIHSWLRQRLRGTGCRPYNADMAVQVSETEIRYPDVSIYCDQPPRADLVDHCTLSDPRVVIEVLSPSTTTLDQGSKLEEYKRIASIRTIAFVDPINEMCRTVERQPGIGWLDHMFSGTSGIVIPSLSLTIPHAEIFARD